MNNDALIAEYKELRRRECELIEQLNAVDGQLIEIERILPEGYAFRGDPPLNASKQDTTRKHP